MSATQESATDALACVSTGHTDVGDEQEVCVIRHAPAHPDKAAVVPRRDNDTSVLEEPSDSLPESLLRTHPAQLRAPEEVDVVRRGGTISRAVRDLAHVVDLTRMPCWPVAHSRAQHAFHDEGYAPYAIDELAPRNLPETQPLIEAHRRVGQ